MLSARVNDLKRLKVNEGLDNSLAKEVANDIIVLINNLSEPVVHNDSQYEWDSGYVKAFERVVEVLKEKDIII